MIAEVQENEVGKITMDAELKTIPLAQLRESPINPRKYFAKGPMEELEASIREGGIRTRLIVRPIEDGGDLYEIAAGARRFRAAETVGLAEVPCEVRWLDDEQFKDLVCFENSQREDPHALDEAAGLQFYLENTPGATVQSVAAKLGCSIQLVYKRLGMLKACDEAKQACWDNRIKPEHLMLIARLATRELQLRALAEGCFDHYTSPPQLRSTRDLQAWIRRECGADLRTAPFDIADATLPGGSCEPCEERDGDSCLSRPCYFGKVSALNTRIAAAVQVEAPTEAEPEPAAPEIDPAEAERRREERQQRAKEQAAAREREAKREEAEKARLALRRAVRECAIDQVLQRNWSAEITDDFAWWTIQPSIHEMWEPKFYLALNEKFSFLPTAKAKRLADAMNVRGMADALRKAVGNWEGDGRRARLMLYFALQGYQSEGLLEDLCEHCKIDLKAIEKQLKAEASALAAPVEQAKPAPKAKPAKKKSSGPDTPRESADQAAIDVVPEVPAVAAPAEATFPEPNEQGEYAEYSCIVVECPITACNAKILAVECADGWRAGGFAKLLSDDMKGLPRQAGKAYATREQAVVKAAGILKSFAKRQQSSESLKEAKERKKNKELAGRLLSWCELIMDESGGAA